MSRLLPIAVLSSLLVCSSLSAQMARPTTRIYDLPSTYGVTDYATPIIVVEKVENATSEASATKEFTWV